jgi:phosphotriesterase-related protein
MTVGGEILPSELGVTQPHEHVFLDIRIWMDKAAPKKLADAPVSMDILGDLKWKDGQNRDNMVLDSFDDAVSELGRFREAGGRSLVDVTVPGIGRDPTRLLKVSDATGLNIVCGTGFYVAPSHPAYVKRKSPEDLAEMMVRELEEGISEMGIRAGVIGEIGCQEPLDPSEAKVLAAAAMAQARTGAGLTVHTALHDVPRKRIAKQAREELAILQRHDCDLSKVYMSHMDFTFDDLVYHRRLMDEFGITLDFDTFGQEQHYNNVYPGAIGIPDSGRSQAIVDHLQRGYAKQLMLACDVCQKIHLRKYGGYGYSNVLERIVPYLRVRGASAKDVRTMMVENPRRILSR